MIPTTSKVQTQSVAYSEKVPVFDSTETTRIPSAWMK